MKAPKGIVIDPATREEFKNYTPTDWAMDYITMYGGIDGSHHKTWVIDQVARILKGTPVVVKEYTYSNGHKELHYDTGKPSKDYNKWVKSILGEKDEYGDYEYDYDEGIAP